MAHAKTYSLYGRDIGCAEIDEARSRQICEAISASLTWQWLGHAIIAPGFKPDFASISNVYCALKISESDRETLRKLQRYNPGKQWMPEWRLESGAANLEQLIENPSRLVKPCE